MSEFRYAQFCPLARAAEIIGERWTLLVVRELLLGPLRFSDLRRRLPGISTSVLSGRLERMLATELIERMTLPAPAASDVFALTPQGQALAPAVIELSRWGMRFLDTPEPGDHHQPEWARLGAAVMAARGASPDLAFEIDIRDASAPEHFRIRGGPQGSQIEGPLEGAPPSTLPKDIAGRLHVDGIIFLALASRRIDVRQALSDDLITYEGDVHALAHFHDLFDAVASSANAPTPM